MKPERAVLDPNVVFDAEGAEMPKPQPGPQEKAMRAKFVNQLFFGGARGGGKSFLLLLDFAQDIATYGKNWRGIIFRRTYPELDEILAESRRIYYQAFPGAEYKVGQRKWFFPNGAEFSLRHLENEAAADSYQGHQYTWIGFDELQQWDNLAAYHKLKACLRSGAQDIPVKRIRATGNPGGVGHQAIKSYFIDIVPEGTLHTDPEDQSSRMYIRSLVTDNKILMDRDPHYVDRLKGVGDELLVKAWLEGDWDSFVGQYFSLWQEKNIGVPSFKIPDHWTLFGGLDYGEANFTSFGLYSVDFDGNIYRLCEYYRDNATASTHAYEINKMIEACPFTNGRRPTTIYADPSMFVKRRLSEVINHSPADVFADHGLFLTHANNDRITGWRVINDALANNRLYAFSGWNDNLFRIMPALPRDRKNPEDLDTHAEDHAADELRYAMMHLYKPASPIQRANKDPFYGENVIDSVVNEYAMTYGRYA
mgnify:FL=1